MNNSNEVIKIIEALFRNGSYGRTIEACGQLLSEFPDDHRLWNLRGCALGKKGYADLASRSFIMALEIVGFRCDLLVNLISSTFARGEPDLACRQIDKFFSRLCPECQCNTLTNVLEAIRNGDVQSMNLPISIANLLKKVEKL